jgi:hypothetical protein
MEGAAILSSLAAAQSPPRGVGEVVGITASVPPDLPSTDPSSQRKITLLTRPPAPSVANIVALSSNPAVASIISAGEANPLISDLQRSGGSGVLLAEALPSPGRAARNDYYDTEDPSVNLHEFIVNSLQAQKNRVVLLKLEEEFLTYVTDPKRVDPLKLPPWDSYHRMLAHRVAAYFGLEHNVDPVDKSCVVVCKGPQTRVPLHRFSDFLSVDPDSDAAEPKLILKRSPRETVMPLHKSFEALTNLPSDVKSFEEREEEYEKTRARIFSQQPLQGSRSNIAFDLANAPQGPRSNLLPAIMQHRRTVSDTLLFRRPSLLEELKKDGPSSSHSSRSGTPLIALFQPSAALLQPSAAGEGGIVGQSIVGQPTGAKVTPQHSPQQHKISPRELPSSQTQVINQQHGAMRPQSKFPHQRPSNVPSFQFQPLAGRGVPMFYPQQTAIMADPSWYYNNMLVYQVSPQQFIPAAVGGATPYGQVIQPSMFPMTPQQYPISPGVVAAASTPSPVISPPISTRPGGFPFHLPMMSPGGAVVEGTIPPSPPHHLTASGGVTLGSFKFDGLPTSALVQPGAYSIGQPMGGAMLAAGGGAQQGRPLIAGGNTSGHLAEHMEQLSLEARRRAGGEGGGEMGIGQIGEGKKPAHELGRNGKAGLVVNGSFPSGYAMMSAIEAGQIMSPTQIHPTAPLQFLPAHLQHAHMIPGSHQEAALMSPQHVPPGTPGGVVHFPVGVPSQSPSGPTTPPIGHMGFPTPLPAGMLSTQQQSIFSPPSTGGVTHSPVQILGHTLGTSLFSPPPSSSAHPGMFVNSPTTGAKVIGYPAGSPAAPHAPVGSGLRFRRYESPKHGNEGAPLSHAQSTNSGLSQVQFISESPMPQAPPQQQKQPHKGNNGVNGGSAAAISGSSGFQPVQLPPRLASQQQGGAAALPQRNAGTRYQNQRHPANRSSQSGKGGGGNGNGGGGGLVGEPGQYLQLTAKKEPLLPTPPNTQMVKLDTTLTCGVPLHVMEIVSLPPDGTPERQQAFKMLRDLGALDIKGGRINKTGEEVLIASFPTPELAIKALQMQNMPFTLSIPRSNHAKFILSLVHPQSVQ